MKFRVLGCSGSELGRHHPCSFMIGESILIDMGCAASRLVISEQVKVTDILISHAHLDHTKDLAFFAENVFTYSCSPVTVRGTQETLDKLKNHLLNSHLWPDFASLPDKQAPVVRYEPFRIGESLAVGDLTSLAIPVAHPGGCVALFLRSKTGCVLYTGDTGPTDAVWEEVNKRKDEIRAILLEASFPNRLAQIANDSGHHTPATFAQELSKIESKTVPIFVYHQKAPYWDEINQELRGIEDDRVQALEPGMVFEF